MRILAKLNAGIVANARTIRPESLWKRYAAAALVLVLLIMSAHVANRSMIERGLIDADVIRKAGEMRLLTQRIVLQAVELVNDPDADVTVGDFTATLDQFEAYHDDLNVETAVSPALWSAYYDAPLNIDARVQLFAASARGVALSLSQGVAADTALQTMISFDHEDLVRDLSQIVSLLVAESRAGITDLRYLQAMISGGAVLVILLQAGLIFYPAHLTVTTKIRELQENRNRLELNQAELRQTNLALERAATHDAMLQLPNRLAFVDKVAAALTQDPSAFGVMHIDIDRFRAINDAAGEQAGDDVLIMVRDVLLELIGPHDVLARTGGDEFMLLTFHDVETLAIQIGEQFSHPVSLNGRRLDISLTIGIADNPSDQKDPLGIISNAELALKAAKALGRGQVVTYSEQLRAERLKRDRLAAELPEALRNGEIRPFFQPQVNLADNSLAGVEVLARWQHPTLGIVPPDVFLPLANAEGLSRKLDQVVWSQAMRQFQIWAEAGLDVPRISLNAAPDTIADARIVPNLLIDMATYGLKAENLAIEVLETTFIGSIYDAAAINIDRLIGAGVTVELDDFGTGYASLSKLIQLSLSGIKLDQSLIHPLPAPNAESIVRAMLAIASEMAIHVVAEGVETDAQAAYLKNVGCDIGQGYGIGRPMPAEHFHEWMTANPAHSGENTSQGTLRA